MPKGDADLLRADIDDGYTGIANLLVEALACCPLTSTEYAVCLFIMRRTYGWAKPKDRNTGKMDRITADEIASGTARPRRTVERAIASLKHSHVIIHAPVDAANTMAYGMNPDVSDWGLPTAEWAWAKTQLREARDNGTYTQKCVHLYAELRTPIRENAYTYTQNCVQGRAENAGTERLSGALQPVVQPYIQPENDSLAPPAAAASSDADEQVIIPDEAFADETTTPAPQPSPLVLFETQATATAPDPEPDNRTYLSEPDPLKRAIWRCWSALGLEGPPASDIGANGKPLSQYSGWHKLAQEHGDRKVNAWASVIERTKPTLPESKKPGAWFSTIFRNAMRAHWTWGWDETTQKLKEPRQAPGPVAMPQEYVDKVAEDLKDWWEGK